MYSVTVSDHVLIAHSFRGEAFGPAQRLHGATLVVEAEFRAQHLDESELLVDIGLAKTELRRVLATLDYSNLDDNPRFRGVNTTIEFLAGHIHGLLGEACRSGRLGPGGQAIAALKVLLRESPNAWAAFEAPIG
ncbi:MAG: 6-carboxytetrahydropterin synthase [Acetobacteraceae bacterium]|nr:6-carboxytetrahydropterin synthase [Acetobacteraceae bacterium]